MTERAEQWLSWAMLAIGLAGFVVTFPMWLLGSIDDHAMIGITLALSWAALWYAAFIAIQEARHARRAARDSGMPTSSAP